MKTHSKEGHVKMEAGTGVTWSQAKEHGETPEAGRGKRTSEEPCPADTLIFNFKP